MLQFHTFVTYEMTLPSSKYEGSHVNVMRLSEKCLSSIKYYFHFSDILLTDEKLDENEALMETFLKILEMLLRGIEIHETEVVCCLIEDLAALIKLQKVSTESQASAGSPVNFLQRSTRQVTDFLREKLRSNMNTYELNLHGELRVS